MTPPFYMATTNGHTTWLLQSEHSTMTSTLQFGRVIETSNINIIGDIISTSLPHEVQRQARMEVIPPPIQ